MTNDEHATEFMNAIGNNIKKLKNEFYNLAHSFSIKSKDDVDDVFNDTIIKVYNTILNKGFETNEAYANNGYTVYFTTSLLRSLQSYNLKRKKDQEKLNHQHTVTSISINDDEYYQMYIKSTAEASEDYELDREEMYKEMVMHIKLKNALDTLPIQFREVLNLRYDGMKYKQISIILSIPITTVKMRLNTARKLLKQATKNG